MLRDTPLLSYCYHLKEIAEAVQSYMWQLISNS